jgi:hypothetical protein
VPELNDTADITERISQARKLFGSMNKQLLGNKKYTDHPSQAHQAIVVNIVKRRKCEKRTKTPTTFWSR